MLFIYRLCARSWQSVDDTWVLSIASWRLHKLGKDLTLPNLALSTSGRDKYLPGMLNSRSIYADSRKVVTPWDHDHNNYCDKGSFYERHIKSFAVWLLQSTVQQYAVHGWLVFGKDSTPPHGATNYRASYWELLQTSIRELSTLTATSWFLHGSRRSIAQSNFVTTLPNKIKPVPYS